MKTIDASSGRGVVGATTTVSALDPILAVGAGGKWAGGLL